MHTWHTKLKINSLLEKVNSNLGEQGKLKISGLLEKVNSNLEEQGIDLEQYARTTGKLVSKGWRGGVKQIKDICNITTHEERMGQLHKILAENSQDNRDIKKWLIDHENRIALLKYWENFALEKNRCRECGTPMRVKRSRESGKFFFACTRPKCPTRPITGSDLELLAKKCKARRLAGR